MTPRTWTPALTVLLLTIRAFLAPDSALAQTELSGQTSGGAYYKIMIPDGWVPPDGLVIWNHGFDLGPIGPVEDLGPLAATQLAEGYAVAASSYSLTGWAVFESHLDNRDMFEAFEAQFGTPEQVLINGASLGGIATARDIEQGLIPNVVGALPICGALSGSRFWDGAVDIRLLYDFLCSDVPGAGIPGGAQGLPDPVDPAFDQNSVFAAANACFGLQGPQNQDQQARLVQFLARSGLPRDFVFTDMVFSTFGLADLVYDPRKLAGGTGVGNANVDYGDAAVNAGIERAQQDQAARRRLIDNYTPSGKVGDVKIVSIHTDKDGLVLVENESEYASVVPPQNLTVGIVVEDQPSHCGFTPAETLAAWETLRGWVAGLPQPTAGNLQDTCNGLALGGLAAGPCRYDPNFVIPDLDTRVRPREICTPNGTTLCLGDNGRFKATVTWKDFDGNSGMGRGAPCSTQDSGSFWFFDPDNIELVVKALDGRQRNDHFWIFYGALTNVEFSLTVTDTETSLQKVYENPLGDFASVGDTVAFR